MLGPKVKFTQINLYRDGGWVCYIVLVWCEKCYNYNTILKIQLQLEYLNLWLSKNMVHVGLVMIKM